MIDEAGFVDVHDKTSVWESYVSLGNDIGLASDPILHERWMNIKMIDVTYVGLFVEV